MSFTLADCLSSIAAQTERSDVLITTSTPSEWLDDVARRFDVPIEVNPRRAGIGSDWNFALTASGARFVTLAHQDDAYLPLYTASVVAPLRASSDALIAFCDFS